MTSRPSAARPAHKYHARGCWVTDDQQRLDDAAVHALWCRTVHAMKPKALTVQERAKANAWARGKGWARFASEREAKRWQELSLLMRAGSVRNLTRQVRYALSVQRPDGLAEVIGYYVADYVYEERHAIADRVWVSVVEDCKGFRTAEYRWKKRHFRAQYGIDIRET